MPITDLYIVHHSALGSCATVYLADVFDHGERMNKLASINGIMLSIDKEVACARFDPPAGPMGDVVLVPDENMTIRTFADRHDLSVIKETPSSHDG